MKDHQHRHLVASTPASYSEGPVFEYWSGGGLSWVIRGFPQSLQAYVGTVPWTGHNRFLSYPFRFINHAIIRGYKVWATDKVAK
jgi:hypothetical protein